VPSAYHAPTTPLDAVSDGLRRLFGLTPAQGNYPHASTIQFPPPSTFSLTLLTLNTWSGSLCRCGGLTNQVQG
jgi:hypothetical protein